MAAHRSAVIPKPRDPPAAGEHRPGRLRRTARRARSWLVWWAILMAFWVIIDYSILKAELLAGAAAAAMSAFVAEVACRQAGVRFRMRARWLLPAFRLPGEVVRDTLIVFGALARRLLRGEQPDSGFREVPVRVGDDSPAGVTRRVLLVGGRSLAPNTFVAGIDKDRGVMITHQLVVNEGREAAE
ncbi:MAG: Na+/H+ antiporter subunit E [Actinobacteria bacterium]|nr:Na+/H+ antiporter subunit E [Actinomycetota bacterium]